MPSVGAEPSPKMSNILALGPSSMTTPDNLPGASGPVSKQIRVDWTVPIWGVVGLLVQGLVIVWWSATQTAAVADTAKRVDKLEHRADAFEAQAVIIARLDERTQAIYDSLQRSAAPRASDRARDQAR